MAIVIDIQPINQRFKLRAEGKTYSCRLLWNGRASCWVLDIETQDGVAIVSGVALVTGSNAFKQLRIGVGAVAIFDSSLSHSEPTIDSLNGDHLVIQLTEAEA